MLSLHQAPAGLIARRSQPIAPVCRLTRRLARCQASSTDAPSPQAEPPQGYQTVPIDQLPRPNPKASKRLQASHGPQTGVYKALVDTLGSVPFTVMSDDADLSWALAQQMSKRLGWFPVSTAKILSGLHKTGGSGPAEQEAQLLAKLGRAALVAEEAKVLAGMRSQRRVIISTLAGGAVTDSAAYTDLWGSFLVWIDEEDKLKPKADTAGRRQVAGAAEMMIKLKKSRGFARTNITTEDKAREGLDALMARLVDYLNDNLDIVERKTNYVSRGCRGDWPEVKPAGWFPVMDGLERKQPPPPEPTA